MSYVLDAGRSDHGLEPLSMRYFAHQTIDYNEVTGTGKSRLTFDCIEIDKAAEYAAEDADVTLRLWNILKPRLTAEHMHNVYETLERPMVPVLARMERRGISIDRKIFTQLSTEFGKETMRLTSTSNFAALAKRAVLMKTPDEEPQPETTTPARTTKPAAPTTPAAPATTPVYVRPATPPDAAPATPATPATPNATPPAPATPTTPASPTDGAGKPFDFFNLGNKKPAGGN